MKTYKKKYHQKNRTFKKRGGAGAAAAHSGERFKCPFCDKTYSAMSNIYIHCEKKHPGQPMPRLTHASTVVRGAERSESERRSGSHRLERDQFVAANGPERFKCPFCDKTYTALTNIYGHCRRKHRGIPMVRLTYDNTIVRPGAAALAVDAAAHPDAPALAVDAAASRLARRMLDSDDSDDDVHPALAAGPAAPPAAAVAVAAMAAPVRVGRIVTRTGTLQGNSHYIINPVMIPNFPTSGNKLQRNSTYLDWIEGDDKNVLDALNGDPDTLAFKINGSFCVITKDELFTLMNNADSIKYECNRICKFDEDGLGGIRQSAEKGVPYLSLGSFSQFQGLVSFFDLWYIVVSQQPQLSQAYELVDARRPRMLSMASHNFLFGPGAAGARAVSAAHCQAGQDASTVYEIHILPIHTHSRSRAATTIQRLVRGHQTRRNPR
jgi:hypothetical protein